MSLIPNKYLPAKAEVKGLRWQNFFSEEEAELFSNIEQAFEMYWSGVSSYNWQDYFSVLKLYYVKFRRNGTLLPLTEIILNPDITNEIKMEKLCNSPYNKERISIYISNLCLLYNLTKAEVPFEEFKRLKTNLNSYRKTIFLCPFSSEMNHLNKQFYVFANKLFEKYVSEGHPLAPMVSDDLLSVEEKLIRICKSKKNNYSQILCLWLDKYLFGSYNPREIAKVNSYIAKLTLFLKRNLNSDFGIKTAAAVKKKKSNRKEKKTAQAADKGYVMDLAMVEMEKDDAQKIALDKLRNNYNWPSFVFCKTRKKTHFITIDPPEKDNWDQWFTQLKAMAPPERNQALANLLDEACNQEAGKGITQDPLIVFLRSLGFDSEINLVSIVKHLKLTDQNLILNLEAFIQGLHGLEAAKSVFLVSQGASEEGIEEGSPLYQKRINLRTAFQRRANSVNPSDNEQYMALIQRDDGQKMELWLQKCISQRKDINPNPLTQQAIFVCGKKLRNQVLLKDFLFGMQKPMKIPTPGFTRYQLPHLNDFFKNISIRINKKIRKMISFGRDCPRANCTGVCIPDTPHFNSRDIARNIYRENYHYGRTDGMTASCQVCGAKICYYCGELWQRMDISKEEISNRKIVIESYDLFQEKISTAFEKLNNEFITPAKNSSPELTKQITQISGQFKNKIIFFLQEVQALIDTLIASNKAEFDIVADYSNAEIEQFIIKQSEIIITQLQNQFVIFLTLINQNLELFKLAISGLVKQIKPPKEDAIKITKLVISELTKFTVEFSTQVRQAESKCIAQIHKNATLLAKITPSKKRIYHQVEKDCEIFAKMKEANDSGANVDDALTRIWLRKNTVACPFCNARVNRSSGCNFMTHTCPDGIRRGFCYCCGDKLPSDIERENAAHYPDGYFEPCINKPCKIRQG